jgi:16S rRNA (adenine1518-N6/adenine1519-N6)-dimethyltransferase
VRLLTPGDVRALLDTHGLKASRALGQHFLADPNTATRIVRLAAVGPGDRVLEIGPGIGSLTLALAAAGAEVLALERDRHILPALADALAGVEGVRVVEGDAMTVDFGELLADGDWAMVSNLPYNIATPLVVRVLEEAPGVSRLLVMVQKEVGERLAAAPGRREAGPASVKVAYHADAAVVGSVPPTVFLPRPKVDSALVRMTRHAAPPVDAPEDVIFALVRAGFGQRRKTLRRALRPVLAGDVEAVAVRAGVDPGARAEALTLDEWAALARAAAEVGT